MAINAHEEAIRLDPGGALIWNNKLLAVLELRSKSPSPEDRGRWAGIRGDRIEGGGGGAGGLAGAGGVHLGFGRSLLHDGDLLFGQPVKLVDEAVNNLFLCNQVG